MILGLILLLLKSTEKLLMSSRRAEVLNSPWKFSATLNEASSVTKIKDKIGTRHFFKDHFTFTPTPAPFRILTEKNPCATF